MKLTEYRKLTFAEKQAGIDWLASHGYFKLAIIHKATRFTKMWKGNENNIRVAVDFPVTAWNVVVWNNDKEIGASSAEYTTAKEAIEAALDMAGIKEAK